MSERGYPSHEERVAARRPPLKHVPTARGLLREDQLGVILPHEHTLADFRALHEPFYPDLAGRPVTLDMLGRLRRHPTTCLDNLHLDDPSLIGAELQALAHAAAAMGGATVVDLSGYGPRGEIGAIARLAEENGVNLVFGTGYRDARFYPRDLTRLGVEGLAARFRRDVEQGLDDRKLRAGAIGEIGIDDPADPLQGTVLRAAARAAAATGVALVLRCPVGEGFAATEHVLAEEKVAPERVILAGMDRYLPDGERERLAGLGYYLLFDGFGQEYYVRGGEARTPRDPERVRWLKALIEHGYLRRLLISQGIDRKMLLVRYGGWGYAHILLNVVPMMERERLAPKQITTMLMYNPARALAFVP